QGREAPQHDGDPVLPDSALRAAADQFVPAHVRQKARQAAVAKQLAEEMAAPAAATPQPLTAEQAVDKGAAWFRDKSPEVRQRFSDALEQVEAEQYQSELDEHSNEDWEQHGDTNWMDAQDEAWLDDDEEVDLSALGVEPDEDLSAFYSDNEEG